MSDQIAGARSTGPENVWFEVEPTHGCVVVSVGGEVDFHSAVGLARAIEASARLSSRLIVDLSQVSFIDSTGLGVLIAARSQARESGGSVSIVHPPDAVRRLLTTTSLQQIFQVYESVDEATRAAGAS